MPVLWDLQRNTIVNNESGEIIRMLNTAFDGIGATGENFVPDALLPQIDEINDRVYHDVNNGVYKAGLPPISRSTRMPSRFYFNAWTTSISVSHVSAILWAGMSPKPTGGFSPRWFALIRSTMATLNVISGV